MNSAWRIGPSGGYIARASSTETGSSTSGWRTTATSAVAANIVVVAFAEPDPQRAAHVVAGIGCAELGQRGHQRPVVLAGEVGEVEERGHGSAVRLRREDAGPGVGGTAHVVAIEERDGEAVTGELVRAGGADETAADHDDVGRRVHHGTGGSVGVAGHVHGTLGQPALHAVDVDDHRHTEAIGVDGLLALGTVVEDDVAHVGIPVDPPRPWICRNVRAAGSR